MTTSGVVLAQVYTRARQPSVQHPRQGDIAKFLEWLQCTLQNRARFIELASEEQNLTEASIYLTIVGVPGLPRLFGGLAP